MEFFYIVYMALLGLNTVWALVKLFDKRKFIKANISYFLGIFASTFCIVICLMGIGNDNLGAPRMFSIVITQFVFTHVIQFGIYHTKDL